MQLGRINFVFMAITLAIQPVDCVVAKPVAKPNAKPSPQRTARRVDQLLAEELFSDGVQLVPPAGDATYLRRVWLDLVGDVPTPEAVTAFLLDPATDKRARIVRQLLSEPQYGQNWARYWRDTVFFRRLEDRSLMAANPMVADLTHWLNTNQPWDKISRRFIIARGDIRENGATAIIASQEGRTEDVTAEMSRIFLGIQIQCAQCHDHPYDRWEREQFHELAAFFPRVALRPKNTPTRRSFQVIANDRPERRKRTKKNNDNRRGRSEHTMPDLDEPTAPGTRMQPKFFLTGAEVPLGTKDADRRGELADWITASEWFATAYVNRIWAELVGEGFYEPIDDLGPDRAATAPQAIEFLAKSFSKSGYDTKWLFRTICETDAYQRQCRPRRDETQTAFTANVAQRLRGDQLFNAVLTVLEVDEMDPGLRRLGGRSMRLPGQRATPRITFATFFGYDPSDPRYTVSGTIPQSLVMMNSQPIHRSIDGRRSQTMLGRLLEEIDDDDAIVQELYLRVLARAPAGKELESIHQYIAETPNRREAFEDTMWALLNSSEFLHRR